MSAKAIIQNLKESKIYKLMYNGKVYGLRVKWFNIETNSFDYYDMQTQFVVSNVKVKEFLRNEQKRFDTLQLKQVGTSLATQDELDGKIIVTEFKDEANAIRVIEPMMYLYK